MLSVGPGNGMLDLPLIEQMAEQGVAAEYVGIDPSFVACERFREGFRRIDPTGVSLDLHACGVDDFEGRSRFDLIHAAHSLYYVPDPAATIEDLLLRVNPRGRLVIFQAPRGALNTLAECFWHSDGGNSIWFSDRLESWLRSAGRGFEKVRLEAELDVTRALDVGDQRGRLVFDFVLHTEVDSLDPSLAERARESLRAISRREDDRWFTPHPVDAFEISPD